MTRTTVSAAVPDDHRPAARPPGVSAGSAGAPRLLALLCDPEVDVDAVLDALRSEPALTARVLKVANSPYYSQRGHVGTLGRAVQMLGLAAIRGIAAAACLDRAMPTRAGPAFEPQRVRQHSVAVAIAAQQLSGLLRAGVDSEAFMAGLLHDIGILVLAQADASAMAGFQPPGQAPADAALRTEREHFGVDHSEAARRLVAAWALPDWLLAPLTLHHLPATAPVGTGLALLPAVIALADHLADRAGLGLWPLCALPPDEAVMAALGLDAASIDDICADLPQRVSQFLALA